MFMTYLYVAKEKEVEGKLLGKVLQSHGACNRHEHIILFNTTSLTVQCQVKSDYKLSCD